MFGFNREKFRKHGEVNDFLGVIRKFENERVELKTVTGAGSSVNYVSTDEQFARKYAINGANRVRMTFDVKTQNLAGGETITATLYHRKKDSDVYFNVGTLTGTVPAVTGSGSNNRGTFEFSDTLGILKKATHIAITGATITVATGCVCDFGLEMWNEDEISVAGDGLATESSAASALAVAQRMNERYRASAPDMYAYTGAYFSSTAFTFTADSGVTPIGANVVQVVARRKAASHGAWYDVPMTKIEITGAAPNYTITLDDATLVADDEIIVVVRGPYRGFTMGTNSFRHEVINGLNTFRTGPQTIGAQQTFTAAYADWGAEIAVANYNKLMLFIDKTLGTSTGLKLQILGKHTGAAADEYVLETDIALGDATGYIAISRAALLNNCVEYIQLQIKDNAGGTGTVNAGSKYELAW